MRGNFSYYNPTKLYFGDESLNYLKDELKNYGPVVLLNYGSGSVKRNGIYDQVTAILKEAGKTIVENPGVMSNPTLEKLHEGVKIARENNVDFILALGGGSVCDYSKGVAASVFYDGDFWSEFWLQHRNPAREQKILPVGCIMTMAGTGSEMNSRSIITDAEHKLKLGCMFDDRVMPRFSILNPKFTMTVPENQMQPGLAKFVRFAKNVWDVCPDGRTDQQVAEEGLAALKAWMQEIGLPRTISEIGATPDMIPGITEGTICYPAGYMDLKPEDITEILKESM